MEVIPTDEVRFSLTLSEPGVRLFTWRGDIYRAMDALSAPFYRSLFERGIVNRLMEKQLLVETEIVPLHLDGYELVLKHRRLPFISYPAEWSASMLRDAALHLLDLNLELAQFDLTTQDAHPWNIAFDGCRSVYIDFGSIAPDGPTTSWDAGAYGEFRRFFVNPLRLMAKGRGRVARQLLQSLSGGGSAEESQYGRSLSASLKRTAIECVRRIAGPRIRTRARRALSLTKGAVNRFRAVSKRQSPQIPRRREFLEALSAEIKGINLPRPKSDWTNYYAIGARGYSSPGSWTLKQKSVCRVLDSLRPSTVLDIGANTGFYSLAAAQLGCQVVSVDTDEASIELLYQEAKEGNHALLPLIMDLRNPLPGHGLQNREYPAAFERLKCDMVLALAVVHHLVINQSMYFDQIVDSLRLFSNRWLLVEFIPREDQYVSEHLPDSSLWYNLDDFRAALNKHFRIIEEMPSDPPIRKLLLCEVIQ